MEVNKGDGVFGLWGAFTTLATDMDAVSADAYAPFSARGDAKNGVRVTFDKEEFARSSGWPSAILTLCP
eukprot:2759378-Prymnesium_polylepis.1